MKVQDTNTINFMRGHRHRVKLTFSLQKWSGTDRFFDGYVHNFLCRVNGL